MTKFIRLEQQDLGRAAIAAELRKLWPGGASNPAFNPAETIQDAMDVAARITELIEHHEYVAHQFRITYLELLAVSPTEWAATFSCSTWNDCDWYESANIGNHPHSARAATPQLAIARAAVSLVPLFENLQK